jgi:hypothetical protein
MQLAYSAIYWHAAQYAFTFSGRSSSLRRSLRPLLRVPFIGAARPGVDDLHNVDVWLARIAFISGAQKSEEGVSVSALKTRFMPLVAVSDGRGCGEVELCIASSGAWPLRTAYWPKIFVGDLPQAIVERLICLSLRVGRHRVPFHVAVVNMGFLFLLGSREDRR